MGFILHPVIDGLAGDRRVLVAPHDR